MAIYLTELDENKLWFPSPYEALSNPNGLLAFGGDLSPDRLLLAYQMGFSLGMDLVNLFCGGVHLRELYLILRHSNRLKVLKSFNVSTNIGSAST